MKSLFIFLENITIMFLAAFLSVIQHQEVISSVVLLNSGKTQNAINVSNEKGSSHLDKVGSFVELKDKNKAASEIKIMSNKEIQKRFSKALAASPKKAIRYILYLKSGRMELTEASKNILLEALKSIKDYTPCMVDIIGHTDTIGSNKGNLKISLKRAKYIEKIIKSKDLNITLLTVKGYGEEDLLVKTPDNTAEVKNRNVEIFIK